MPFEPDEEMMRDRQDMFEMPGMSGEEEPGMIAVPGFQMGERVERTGIALVHEGEYIYPAPGSEASIVPDMEEMQPGQVINYYFPVEVEVVGTLSDVEMQRGAQFVYDELTAALQSQQPLV